MAKCLLHEWFSAKTKSLLTVSPTQFDALQSYCNHAALKRAFMLEVAARLPMECSTKIVDIFKRVDVNLDGCVSYPELRDLFKSLGLKDEVLLKKSFQLMDINSDGVLSFTEFAAGVLPIFGELLQDRLRALFVEFDKDKDGALSKDEVRSLFANASRGTSKDGGRKLADDMVNTLFHGGRRSITYRDLRERIVEPVQPNKVAG